VRCEVVACLTEPPGGVQAQVVRNLAEEVQAQIFTGRPNDSMSKALNDLNLDLLVCAAYMYRLPISDLNVNWAVNIHPTMLPQGRGENPLPYLVECHRELCGISIHEMTMELDKGPILLQERVQLSEHDTLDVCYLKLFAKAPQVLRTFISDIQKYFSTKRVGGEGSYWPEKADEARTVDASTARVDDFLRVSGAECSHLYKPGEVVAQARLGNVIAVMDGLVSLGSTQAAYLT